MDRGVVVEGRPQYGSKSMSTERRKECKEDIWIVLIYIYSKSSARREQSKERQTSKSPCPIIGPILHGGQIDINLNLLLCIKYEHPIASHGQFGPVVVVIRAEKSGGVLVTKMKTKK